MSRSRPLQGAIGALLIGAVGAVMWSARPREEAPSAGIEPPHDTSRTVPAPLETSRPLAEAAGLTERPPSSEVVRQSASGAIRGRVLRSDGQIVREPSVAFRTASTVGSDRDRPVPPGNPWVDVEMKWEDEGRFEIERVDEGTYLIVARERVSGWDGNRFDASARIGWWLAYGEYRVPGTESLDLTLGPMESIRGVVTGPDGNGLRDFHIEATPLSVRKGFEDFVPVYFHNDWSFQSSSGEFQLVGLVPGEWKISASEGGYAEPVPIRIDVPRKEPLSFELLRSVELNGRIVDSAGENLRGRALVTWAESGRSIAAGEDGETTWGNGLFRLHAPPTMVELRATFEGRESEPLQLDLTMGRPRDGLRLVVPRKP